MSDDLNIIIKRDYTIEVNQRDMALLRRAVKFAAEMEDLSCFSPAEIEALYKMRELFDKAVI